MITAYEIAYEHFILKGYTKPFSHVKAENHVKEIRERNEEIKPIQVMVPGIGNCAYSGD